MGRMSKTKGKVGEREAAKALQAIGIDAQRGVQFQGGGESPDVKCSLPNCHIEVKRTEALRLYDAVKQATDDGCGKVPVVLHRKNREEWVAIVPLSRLPELAADVYLNAAGD